MASAITIERAQWLGYRWTHHGLSGVGSALDDLLRLGFQDARAGGALHALIQRTRTIGSAPVATALSAGGSLATMWSVRGAPHAHPITHLDFVRDALRPQDDEDGGPAYVDAMDEVAAALTSVVTRPMSKSDASTGVTGSVSASLVSWCERCAAKHVPDGLFRAAGRQAQVVLAPAERGTVLAPRPQDRQAKVAHPREDLLGSYFRVNGPANKAQYRDWLESSTAAVTRVWGSAGDLVKVRVDGKPAELPEALLGRVQEASAARGVVLVPPGDPYLRQADRTLLVPYPALRQQVWRPVSAPGALLIDGEVAGVWRYRGSSHDVTITPFHRVSPGQRKAAETSARRVDRAAVITWG